MRTTFENIANGEHFEYAGDAWVKLTDEQAQHLDTGEIETFAYLGAIVTPMEYGMMAA